MEHSERNSSARGGKLASTIEQAGNSARQVINQLATAARPAVSRAALHAHRLVDGVAGGSSRVAQGLEESGARLKDAEQRLAGASSGYVREHPFRTAGIALAAVFLGSRLLLSRRATQRDGESAQDGGASAPADE